MNFDDTISGAHNGLHKLPQYLPAYLNDRDTWRLKELTQLAQKTYELNSDNTVDA